ncbi:restriction endonuclease subunit S [Leptospira mayottensis]|uniref:Type I restriction modification DNA specificity domain protein n=2 Tax=Leptospira mayottensis TaxID=1137606 RepID=A0AA87MME6_9LEPT|nr:restriction endonuclease subunit S [Leptospira mayottensis]AXR63482.1 type I restriction endonuclease subunit S [Leptospira mayottensis]EKR99015.1 type I restriction modification DNA specificity domain protein [Leptospira mayottensis 200901122]
MKNNSISFQTLWITVSLGQVAEINPKLTAYERLSDDLEVQFLPMKLVEEVSGKIQLSEVRKIGEVKKGYTPFENEDVIFAKVTPCMENGKIAHVSNLKNGIGFGSSEFHVIRSSDAIKAKYIFYYVVRQQFRNEAEAKMTGAVGLRRVPKQFIESVQIPLPPLAEQQRIVSKIEELFSELDKGIENLRTVQQQLKVYRQAVLKSAFEGKLSKDWRDQNPDLSVSEDIVEEKDSPLGELPSGWKWVKIRDVASIFSGYTFKSKDFVEKGRFQVLRMGNIRPGILKLNESPVFLNKIESKIIKRVTLEVNDIVITQTGTRKKRDYGYTALINQTGLLLNQRIASIRFHPEYYAKFFLFFSWTNLFKDQFFTNETGNVGQGNVGIKSVTESFIPLPYSLLEQQVIVQEIESRLSICDKLEETIQSSLKQAESLRQSILKKAFEGKLVAQDPKDEPASALLERIRAEKESIFQKTNANSKKKTSKKQNPENGNLIQFPRLVPDISTTELHAGVIAMVIDAHERQSKYLENLNHVKCEKISHLVESYIGISLGRNPVKDAAGPDDYPHLKVVESRALKANYFGIQKQKLGYTYLSKHGLQKVIDRTSHALNAEDLQKIRNLIQDFMPLDKLRSEVVATLFAAWNNLLLEGKLPTDEEIVFEARENWTPEKLKIPKENFLKTLSWMRKKGYVPEGKGVIVSKSVKKTSAKKRKKTKA